MYQVTKTFGHDLGLSAVFRQWRATHSHCQFLHGYALSVTLVFEADTLDARNWVIDFGALDHVRLFLRHTFDHKLVVALDDPMLPTLEALADAGLASITKLEAVGCEAFAKYIYDNVSHWLGIQNEKRRDHRVHLSCVKVAEHGANSATYAELSPLPMFDLEAVVDAMTLSGADAGSAHGLQEPEGQK